MIHNVVVKSILLIKGDIKKIRYDNKNIKNVEWQSINN